MDAPSRSSAIHARLVRERPHELQPAVRARLEVGLHISAHDCLQARRPRTRYAREFVARVFGEVDALVAPVIPEPAPALDAVKAGSADDIVRRMGRFSRLGRPFDEATTLRLGHAHERAAGWVARRPALA